MPGSDPTGGNDPPTTAPAEEQGPIPFYDAFKMVPVILSYDGTPTMSAPPRNRKKVLPKKMIRAPLMEKYNREGELAFANISNNEDLEGGRVDWLGRETGSDNEATTSAWLEKGILMMVQKLMKAWYKSQGRVHNYVRIISQQRSTTKQNDARVADILYQREGDTNPQKLIIGEIKKYASIKDEYIEGIYSAEMDEPVVLEVPYTDVVNTAATQVEGNKVRTAFITDGIGYTVVHFPEACIFVEVDENGDPTGEETYDWGDVVQLDHISARDPEQGKTIPCSLTGMLIVEEKEGPVPRVPRQKQPRSQGPSRTATPAPAPASTRVTRSSAANSRTNSRETSRSSARIAAKTATETSSAATLSTAAPTTTTSAANKSSTAKTATQSQSRAVKGTSNATPPASAAQSQAHVPQSDSSVTSRATAPKAATKTLALRDKAADTPDTADNAPGPSTTTRTTKNSRKAANAQAEADAKAKAEADAAKDKPEADAAKDKSKGKKPRRGQ